MPVRRFYGQACLEAGKELSELIVRKFGRAALKPERVAGALHQAGEFLPPNGQCLIGCVEVQL